MASLNAEQAVYTLLTNAGYHVYTALPSPLEIFPVIWVQKVGGARNGVLSMDRLQIAVISDKRRTSSDTAEAVLDMLIDTYHVVPGHGLIDYVEAESTPVEVPFKDNLINNIFTIAVHSRVS